MVSGIIPVLHSPRLLQSGIVKLTFAGSVTRAALWRFVQTISCANLSRTKSFAESKFAGSLSCRVMKRPFETDH